MKINLKDTTEAITILDIIPESVKESMELLRLANISKNKNIRITAYFSNDDVFCNVIIPKQKPRDRRCNSISNFQI